MSEGELRNSVSGEVRRATREELLKMFDEEVHGRLVEAASRKGVEYLVVYENLMMDSSHFGDRVAVTVGPSCTIPTLVAAVKNWLGDVPSRRQYPVVYIPAGDVAGRDGGEPGADRG